MVIGSIICDPNGPTCAVGSITELTGTPAQIERSKTKLTASKGTGIEMNDSLSTAKQKLELHSKTTHEYRSMNKAV
jgi:hypothetical protein